MIKGGVWKNTEDEILKAAVMKYGLNQWARISSLLVRKSAKQCKARWYEWLDPSIKKTEWTREEDEKLLHLAKLMPCQWRTIAPIVGRTPAQCLDRYERLLDQAVAKDVNYDPRDDPRRLRPGEIDPNPESKPARPDAVDMDEDEKEMLSEARARLANTRGKKAKRKAREKQLEEARRLAQLQKKRELKAAGIEVRGRFKNARAVDYNAEVPFELKPQAGFYSTEEEEQVTRSMQQEFRPVTVEELEGRRRKDIEEALIKKDIKRQKLNEMHDAPGAVAQAMGLDQQGARRRGKLMLPAPQVSEAELEQIARLGVDGALEASVQEGAGGDATRTLLGQYGQTPRLGPGATPMRTPRTGAAGGGDRIMAEAAALARLQGMGTVLEGGDTGVDVASMDFAGVTPRHVVAATPNPLAAMATPSVRGGAAAGGGGATGARIVPAIAGAAATPSVAGTPLRGGGSSAVPGATPLLPVIRDELGLNEADVMAAAMEMSGGNKRAAAARQAAVRGELRDRLAGLPAPQNEYAFEVPEVEQEAPAEEMEEDLADARARKAREEEERRRLEELKKSKAVQRQLPRPLSVDSLPGPKVAASAGVAAGGLRERAEELVAAEMAALLTHDANKYPVKDSRADTKKKSTGPASRPAGPSGPLEEFDLQELKAADELVQREVAFLRKAWDHTALPPSDYLDVWLAVHRDLIYLPSRQRYERAASATNVDRIESIKCEFEFVRGDMEREARKAAKLEAKLGLLLTGLQRRHGELSGRIGELWGQVRDAAQELACFKALHERELHAAPERLEALGELLSAAQRREVELQERYKALTRRMEDLTEALART
ncbi:hypothetical protein VOLCADRAFT_107065 [Volvox carteri f. nagariensis]|uniref:Uncharacterized protein n=1 Tax=Volvox carteri f. nagariensis TaxID=3068 RepID=D8UBS5_VOLCA|nr:uncharacterized protein VOLCADRAFT_107065 [Volvox carteri f. nagariensis]EFJ42818.1 hypothetical protein VOLCADRAFT_107065 [Volvox carteri f. nagariensis]|eukprot:XP_002956078.1 hypothetical protein VOLCADRAFT_107065 [Volvox carteri f. nagariensis]